jgi:hypothetical protein
MSTATSPATTQAFKRAVAADYAGEPLYPDGAVIMPGRISSRDMRRVLSGRDALTTPLVFVENNGLHVVFAPQETPRNLRQRLLAKLGVVWFDIELRDRNGGPLRLRRGRPARGPRHLARLERHAFS